MNRYILIRRLRGPAIVLLLGLIALLHEAGLVEFWGLFFPLLLILIGILKLAERAALATAGTDAFYPYGPANPAPSVTGQPPQPGTSIVPAPTHDFGKGQEGGQS